MMKYRWLLVLGILSGLAVIVWIALPQTEPAVKPGSGTSGFFLPDLQGEMQSLPKGEVVLLNFWATWCPPCRQEIPSMIALDDRYAADGLKIVAVSVDHRLEDLTRFVGEYNMPFQVLHDGNSAVSQQFGVFRFPESFLIDRQGKVRYHLIGAIDWMSAEVVETIETMLKEDGDVSGDIQPGGS